MVFEIRVVKEHVNESVTILAKSKFKLHYKIEMYSKVQNSLATDLFKSNFEGHFKKETKNNLLFKIEL